MHPAPQETEAALFTALPEALPWRGRPPGAAPIHSFLEGPSSTRPRGQQGLRPPTSVELLPEAGDGMPRRPDTADSEARRPTMGEVASTVPGGQRAWITPQKAPRSSRMKRVKPGNRGTFRPSGSRMVPPPARLSSRRTTSPGRVPSPRAARATAAPPHKRAAAPVWPAPAMSCGGATAVRATGAANPVQRHISTGRSAFSSTCRVTPPRMSWRRREWL